MRLCRSSRECLLPCGIGPSALTNPCPVTDMEQLSNRLSKVFSDYPELFNHCVKVYQKRVDYYRLTSEGQKILQPDTAFHITARASIKTDGNEVKTEYYRLHVGGINDLPSGRRAHRRAAPVCPIHETEKPGQGCGRFIHRPGLIRRRCRHGTVGEEDCRSLPFILDFYPEPIRPETPLSG